MEIGITTFVENTPDPATGKLLSPQERMSNLMEEIELSDQLGLDETDCRRSIWIEKRS